MHKVTFYPLGNADCCLIDLKDGDKKLLFDYANCRDANDRYDLRIDLAETLKRNLEDVNRDYFDVVGFTHADDDHIHGFSEFFYLEHASKYQDDERIKIKELWVPAASIIETGEQLQDEGRILRAEARHRLIAGTGIRVFSRPDHLKAWLEEQGLTLESRQHLMIDAGKIVPGFNKLSEGVEFFVHSPFAVHVENGVQDRNECSLILQAVFLDESVETKLMLIGDTTNEILTQIVEVTQYHSRNERLAWDVFDVPHHCSYLALGDEKGKEKTEPVEKIKWLLEQGSVGGIIVSPSKIIPPDDTIPPPHRQAANYYKGVAKDIDGEFRVTMEHPSKSAPKPLVIKIDGLGATVEKLSVSAGAAIAGQTAPRVG
jgi:hypothetical protein